MKFGAVVDGIANTINGVVNGGTISAIEVRGENNNVMATIISGNVVDNGINSSINTTNFNKSVGVTKGRKKAISIPTPGVWVDVAEVVMYPSSSGDLRAATLKASASAEVIGIGRDCYNSMWLVRNKDTSQSVDSIEQPNPFNPLASIKLRVTPTVTNKARLQIQIAGIVGAIGVKTVDVIYSLYHDQYSKIIPL